MPHSARLPVRLTRGLVILVTGLALASTGQASERTCVQTRIFTPERGTVTCMTCCTPETPFAPARCTVQCL